MLQSKSAGLSDVGKVRKQNEDDYVIRNDQGLFLVSDGMGGHRAGQTASSMVATLLPDALEQQLSSLPLEDAETVSFCIRDAIVAVSQTLWQRSSQDPALAGMGATLALLVTRSTTAFIAHMGDSRVYLFRSGRLQQLTTDHSLVSLLQSTGEITAEEARTHPARNRITRHVGMERTLYPDVQSLELSEGDRLLLCTDGLNGMIDDEHIAEILARCKDPEEACQALVDAANAAGGKDNVTALVVNLDLVER